MYLHPRIMPRQDIIPGRRFASRSDNQRIDNLLAARPLNLSAALIRYASKTFATPPSKPFFITRCKVLSSTFVEASSGQGPEKALLHSTTFAVSGNLG